MLLGLTTPNGAGGAGARRNVATCFLSSELPSAGESHPNWMCPTPCPLTKCFINPGFGAGGRPWPPRATWTHLSPHLLSAPSSHPPAQPGAGAAPAGLAPGPQAWSCPVPSEAFCRPGAGALACPRLLPAHVVIARPSQWETTARGWSLGHG
ncbi:unnamed protein product [Rangifer tarandus platyrhynchus]|uniref:Uncharacterized protein n=2 Tax=Rangifer tarandus platyrhynchus TaxID=3082113 RepID=A0AC59ZAG4_RANTA|nr:unnamed protein product [Rangifer tarandus platyrhynchus]